MKATRILYSPAMARARRAGIKTQTRRLVKPQPNARADLVVQPFADGRQHFAAPDPHADDLLLLVGDVPACPYGQPGDLLLPVEPWRAPVEFDRAAPRDIPAGVAIWLEANGAAPAGFGRYRHARFMPRHLAAERDEITAVRVERLQDISAEDAIAEGIEPASVPGRFRIYGRATDGADMDTPRISYHSLWESINGPDSWDANPWVWVLSFRRLR